MKFPLSLINYNLSVDMIVDIINKIGLEVEKIIDKKFELEKFEIVQIISIVQHPNADKLKICTIANKFGEKLQIVCGANNARANIKTVLAPIDSIIPNGNFKIKKSVIRGIESYGMLCSANELNLSNNKEDGIIEISQNIPLSENVYTIFGYNDPILELNITPNRGDCLSIIGIIREINAYLKIYYPNLELLSIKPYPIKLNNIILPKTKNNTIISQNKEFCSTYYGCLIKNINNQPSPDWLLQKILSLGLKPISAIVDILNYITYELGQPFHVYDADKMKFPINIKSSSLDEFYDLNGKQYCFKDIYTISDQCIAGIIGNNETRCTLETTNIYIEAAIFNPISIAIANQKLKIQSDAAYRFERGIDYKQTYAAFIKSITLIKEICSGEITELNSINHQQDKIKTIKFNNELIYRMIGINIPHYQNILKELGFNIVSANDIKKEIWQIPSWRNDCTIQEDLIEEIIRMHGFNKLDIDCQINFNPISISKDQKIKAIICDILIKLGFNECISFPFTDESLINPTNIITIANPINSNLPNLRTSLLYSLVNLIKFNINKGNTYGSIFEIDKIYNNNDMQSNIACVVKFGTFPSKWHHSYDKLDFYQSKKINNNILQQLGYNCDKLKLLTNDNELYHPKLSATIYKNSEILARFGLVNPILLNKLDISTDCIAIELFLDNIECHLSNIKKALDINHYPVVLRDFTFKQSDIAVIDIIKQVYKVSSIIKNIVVKDIYNSSITFAVEMQDKNKTLTNEEINNISSKISIILGIDNDIKNNQ